MQVASAHPQARYSPHLCGFCKDVVLRQSALLTKNDQAVHYPKRERTSLGRHLQSEACTLCNYVFSLLKAQKPELTEEEVRNSSLTSALCSPPRPDNNFGGVLRINGLIHGQRGFEVTLACRAEDSVKHRPIWTSCQVLEPLKRLESAAQWLENCEHNHDRCQALEASLNTACPTRLIDVSQPTLRLVCLPENTKVCYAALSHCWGGGLPIKSTKKTLSDHMVAIRTTALPKTFLDAVATARNLHIQYLWIDSLCIVQDDAQDWEREAARMASVYEGARITIAAAWGRNGETGCFHDHCPSMAIDVQEQGSIETSADSSTTRLYFRPFANRKRYLGDATLNSRAWTLQEIILSRRILLFAEDQLYWHCTSFYESEDGLEVSDNMTEQNLALPSLGLMVRQPEIPLYELYESWQFTMQIYSGRSLTRSSDKLAALVGVTDMFQRAVKDVPLAGLWRKNICKELLWSVFPHGKLDSNAISALNIPSWSWTKAQGQVSMYVSGVEPCVEISSASVSWIGLPLASKIKQATITGRGKIVRIVDIQRGQDESCMCRAKCFRFDTQPDEPMQYGKGYWRIDECVVQIKDAVSCLLIYSDERVHGLRREPDPNVTEISALIVVNVQNSHPASTYRRMGTVRFEEFPRVVYRNSSTVDFTLI